MPRGRMRASDGIADPHCVQKAAGGVDRWHVGHRISPGFGVAISAALCLPRPVLARARRFATLCARCNGSMSPGTSCSGKTTLARAISQRLGLAHIELDALFWGRDWTPGARRRPFARASARRPRPSAGSCAAATRRLATCPGRAPTRSSGSTIRCGPRCADGRAVRSPAFAHARNSGRGRATGNG